jgi:hypothetical protein
MFLVCLIRPTVPFYAEATLRVTPSVCPAGLGASANRARYLAHLAHVALEAGVVVALRKARELLQSAKRYARHSAHCASITNGAVESALELVELVGSEPQQVVLVKYCSYLRYGECCCQALPRYQLTCPPRRRCRGRFVGE